MPVTGAAELQRLAVALRAAGRQDLRKDLLRGLRNGAKPMVPAARQAAATHLPKRGGLAADIAGAKWGIRTRAGTGRGAGVRIVGAWGTHDMAALDSGLLRHPTFGRRGRGDWKDQKIPAHWFTDAMQHLAPEFRDQLEEVIDDVANRLAGSV